MTREYALKNIKHNVGTYVEMDFFINEIYDYFEAQQKPKKILAIRGDSNLVEMLKSYSNINTTALMEWMAYKKYKSKGAVTKTLKMLNKYDHHTQQEMVDLSIGNEYAGLFPPKKTFSRTNNNVNVAKNWVEENDIYNLCKPKQIGG